MMKVNMHLISSLALALEIIYAGLYIWIHALKTNNKTVDEYVKDMAIKVL